MKIITIVIGDDNGKATLQSILSDGIDPALAAEACERVADSYREAAIEAEVQRRLEAAKVAGEADG